MKKSTIILTITVFFILLLVGCAHVNFYSDKNLQTKTGIEFFSPKPYLLVVNLKSTKSIDLVKVGTDSSYAQIVYLPDLSNPMYMEPCSGLGTNDIEIEMDNGMIKSFNNKSDAEIPETIDKITGLLGKIPEVFKGLSVTKGKEGDKTDSKNVNEYSSITFKLFEIIITKTGTTLVEVQYQR